VRIGRHSVVGAGSVVTKSIPDGEVWAGVPAHQIS
jgi:acetyltransferase-like isoleucine patch superfamily enzyme